MEATYVLQPIATLPCLSGLKPGILARDLARIWVKVPSIPSGGTTIYLYYGNPAASAASNGTTTFVFFDNDWTNLTSRWTINGGTPIVNTGIVSFASGATMQTRAYIRLVLPSVSGAGSNPVAVYTNGVDS